MNFDFSNGRITIVVAPVDMRSGYDRLASIARSILGIDVDRGGEFILFASKSAKVCKMIWQDEKGMSVLTRRLHRGRFERFMSRAKGPATQSLTADDLMQFLDGEPIMIRRSGLLFH